MLEVTHTIDGWQVRVERRRDDLVPYHAVATDPVWGRGVDVFAANLHDCLCRLADKCAVDREELLTTFGSKS